ncbi:MAG: hypothetical protein A3I66_13555, partial [Burkholderiales bacterium RIFCSPLOWO2_02_FULL_57_36]
MATTSNAAVRPSHGEHIGKLFRARSLTAHEECAVFFGAPSMGALLEVQVLPQADHSERSEAQLRKGD